MSRATSLSPQDFYLLDQWGRQLYEALGETPYLVGSVARAEERWRDVDVRMVAPDASTWLFGELPALAVARGSLRLRTINLALTLWGRQVTGLPIDFQIQPADEFHSYDDQRRSALGFFARASDPEDVAERNER